MVLGLLMVSDMQQVFLTRSFTSSDLASVFTAGLGAIFMAIMHIALMSPSSFTVVSDFQQFTGY